MYEIDKMQRKVSPSLLLDNYMEKSLKNNNLKENKLSIKDKMRDKIAANHASS